MATLDCTAGTLGLELTAGRDKTFTITAQSFSLSGYTHLAEFRQTPDLNSNVLFTLSTANGKITQVVSTDSVVTFQISAANTADLGGQTIYWSWKLTSGGGLTDDWVEGPVTIKTTPTS